MNFDGSFRSVRVFHLTFIRFMYTSDITRAQLIYLSFLIENGLTKDFKVLDTIIPGLSWENSNRYLQALKQIRYATKKAQLWSLSEESLLFYTKFKKDFARANSGPFTWK